MLSRVTNFKIFQQVATSACLFYSDPVSRWDHLDRMSERNQNRSMLTVERFFGPVAQVDSDQNLAFTFFRRRRHAHSIQTQADTFYYTLTHATQRSDIGL